MIRLYSRCNSGHYFEGTHCPLDGWSSGASVEIAAALDTLRQHGTLPSIDAVRALGVSEDSVKRCIVVEFGDTEAAFEAIAPEGYIVDGKWIPQRDFDSKYT